MRFQGQFLLRLGVLIGVSFSFFGGCLLGGGSYQKRDQSGLGYVQKQLGPTRFEIRYYGKGYQPGEKSSKYSPSEMIKYLYRRSAEITLESELDYFTVEKYDVYTPNYASPVFRFEISMYKKGSEPLWGFEAKKTLNAAESLNQFEKSDSFVPRTLDAANASKYEFQIGPLHYPYRPQEIKYNLERTSRLLNRERGVGYTVTAGLISQPYLLASHVRYNQYLQLAYNGYETDENRIKDIKEEIKKIEDRHYQKKPRQTCFDLFVIGNDQAMSKSQSYQGAIITELGTYPLSFSGLKPVKLAPGIETDQGYREFKRDTQAVDLKACTSSYFDLSQPFQMTLLIDSAEQDFQLIFTLDWQTPFVET